MKRKTKTKPEDNELLTKGTGIRPVDVIFCVIGGVLMALSLPKAGFFVLAWICLIPLLPPYAPRDPQRRPSWGLFSV